MSKLPPSNAYWYLGLDDTNDASLADEDIGVAFYKSLFRQNSSRNALNRIAEYRKSRFLRFLATIGEHLNERNVAVLAKKTWAASPEPESVDEEPISPEPVGAEPADEELPQNHVSEAPESEMEMDAYGEPYATSEDGPSQPISPSSSEASFSSSDGMNADSDFSEEVGGIFFDRFVWRCEECSSALLDWKCLNGHELTRCKNCGWQLDNGPCQRCLGMCDACGGEMVGGQCISCGAGEESEDEDTIVFDEGEGLWRCVYCQWEVEAENETDGNCHCLNDKLEAHFIDLSDCLDYEPADSCSSEDDSTDSEPNSDDEGFIDDTEIPLDGTEPDAAIENVNLAAIYPACEIEKITKATEMVNAAEMIKDKENVEPTASSDDIEVINGPIAHGPPKLPSNIIDCESMDM